METYLLGIFNPQGYNSDLYNSIKCLLRSKGRALVRDICGYSVVSQRQMELLKIWRDSKNMPASSIQVFFDFSSENSL